MYSLIPVLGLMLALLPAAARDGASVVAASNQFAFDLRGQLGDSDANLIFSPYSISKALAMAYADARGDTEREMAAVLHFTLGPGEQHRAFLEMRRMLNRNHPAMNGNTAARKPIPQLYLAVNLWGQAGYGFQKSVREQRHSAAELPPQSPGSEACANDEAHGGTRLLPEGAVSGVAVAL